MPYYYTKLAYLVRKDDKTKHKQNRSHLASLLGVNRLTLIRWIAGETEPSPSQLAELANYYDERIERFFDGVIMDE